MNQLLLKNCNIIYVTVTADKKRKLLSDSENEDDQNKTEQKAKKERLDENEAAGPSEEMEQVKEAPAETAKGTLTDFDDGGDDNRTGT